jgi:LPPG:FO 2-phospho-L-lactate transferase
VVRELAFDGAATARPTFLEALSDPRLTAVVICPSNPFISVEPILAMPGIRAALLACGAPVIAVSPIIGGRAIKGPTAKMMQELGLEVSAASVARRYGDILDGYIIDHADADTVLKGPRVFAAPTLMTTLADREALARMVLSAAAALRR